MTQTALALTSGGRSSFVPHMCAPLKKIPMPEVKLIKAQFVFGDVELDFGFTRVKVHTLQVLRENAK